MKKSAIFTLLIYCLTLTAPCRSHAAVPLAFIAAGAIGASLLATSSGTYYAQEGKSPEYVAATVDAVASASDYLFQPAHLAIGPIALVTAASFPNKVSTYLGTTNAVGIGLNDLWNSVKENPSQFPDLSEIFENSTDTPDAPSINLVSGQSVVFPDSQSGERIRVTIPNPLVWYTSYKNIEQWPWCLELKTPVSGYYLDGFVTTNSPYLYLAGPLQALIICKWIKNSSNKWDLYYIPLETAVVTNDPPTVPPPSGSVDWNVVKNSLQNPSPSVAAEVQDAIKSNPGAAVTAAEVPATAGAQTAPNTITQDQINQLLKENTAAVAQAASDAAAQVAAANPSDAAAQIAALQAAVNAAQASSDLADYKAEKEDYTATPPGLTIPALKAVSFQPIIDARTLTMTKAPFTWFGSLPGILDGLVASPSAPNFTIDLGIFQQEIDLAFLDPFASTCRSIVAFFMYLMTVFLMIKIFRSM